MTLKGTESTQSFENYKLWVLHKIVLEHNRRNGPAVTEDREMKAEASLLVFTGLLV